MLDMWRGCKRLLILSPSLLPQSSASVSCRVPLHKSQPAAALTISPPSCPSSATPRSLSTSPSWTTFLCHSSQSRSGTHTRQTSICHCNGKKSCTLTLVIPASGHGDIVHNVHSLDLQCWRCALVSCSQVLARHRHDPARCRLHQRGAGPTPGQLLGALACRHVHLPAVAAGAQQASAEVWHRHSTFGDLTIYSSTVLSAERWWILTSCSLYFCDFAENLYGALNRGAEEDPVCPSQSRQVHGHRQGGLYRWVISSDPSNIINIHCDGFRGGI